MVRPLIRRIAIIGVGLIGGSIGLRARLRLRGVRIVGIDRPAALRRALRRGAIDEGTSSLPRGLAGADLIVLAMPVGAILGLLPRLRRLAPSGAVITDVGGTKEAILRSARAAGLEERFVGGHPMAGSERSGVAHADGGLLAGAPWILCPGRETDRRAVARVRSVVTRLGARPAILSARSHDEVMARLSHLPQLLSVALVNAAARGAALRSIGLAGPAFRQMSRLACSSPVLWEGILATNRSALGRAVGEFVREIARLRSTLGPAAMVRFRRAARLRARLEPGARKRS